MPIKTVIADRKWPVKIWTEDVEDTAVRQLANLADMPFIYKHVAAMPDVHAGLGATVGSVIATKGAIIPAAVGVDIGCGMMAVRLDGLTANDLPDNLSLLRAEIEAAVPHGRTDNGGKNDRGAWGDDAPKMVDVAWNLMYAQLNSIGRRYPKLLSGHVNSRRHLGTLGTGNHFIEVCLDEDERVWVMLHSGSRGIGNRIGSFFIELAKEDMRKWFVNVPDQDLAYLPEGTEHFFDYWEAVEWAQRFASTNRQLMMRRVTDVIWRVLDRRFFVTVEIINCHHNYVARENHFGANVCVTRKGAIRARQGDLGIIPGSMGTGSFIVRGLGNADSFHSCSHGAGRRMGRKEAKRRFTVADLEAQTRGIECRKDADVIDEIPGAYKPIGEVMQNQNDLVEVVHRLRQVINIKG